MLPRELACNFHTHTTLCDGKNTPEEMAEEAVRLGMWGLGFSGHMDPDIHMDFPAYAARIRALREEYRGRLEIFLGTELDVLYDKALCAGAEYIIGSTHFLDVDSPIPMSVDNTEEMFLQLGREYFGGDFYRLAKRYYELEAKVFDVTGCTFVGHFDLVTRFNDHLRVIDEEDERYRNAALTCMEHLVRQGVPFEVNCGAFNRGRKKELYPSMFLLRKLSEFGGSIFLSSDAHDRALLTGGFEEALARIRACGFESVLVLKHGENGVETREVSVGK